MSADLYFGIAIGFIANWLLCAICVVAWIAASTIATRRQRRRGRASW